MQLDQPGEIPPLKEQVAYIARARSGARAAMRVTNRYTMPPLEPRTQQHSDPLLDAQGQELAAPLYHPMAPLSLAEEDALLHDVLPPFGPKSVQDHASEGNRTIEEFEHTVEASAGTRATTR